MTPGPDRRGRLLTLLLPVIALVGGWLFFTHVAVLWPLLPGQLRATPAQYHDQLVALDPVIGTHLERDEAACRLRLDSPALSTLEEAVGRERARELVAHDGLPLAWQRVTLKQRGNADVVSVCFLLDGRLMGWERTLQDDEPEREPKEEPEILAREAAERLVPDLAAYRVTERATVILPNRTDRRWTFERAWDVSDDCTLRERLQVTLAGSHVIRAMRSLVPPSASTLTQRARAAAKEGLEALGFSLLGVGSVAAAVVGLRRLARGQARLGPAGAVTAVVAGLLACTHLLQPALLFEQWDPLWPRWIATARDLAFALLDDSGVLIPLFCFLLAGDALDRERQPLGQPAPERGRSLWLLGRGRLADPTVAAASWRGFLVGAACGGVLTLGTLLAVHLLGARIELQPRGFFFYPLTSSSPPLITLCFFTHIALLEELGYRFFAGTWLDRLTGLRSLAIVLPAVVYGLCHSAFAFLPPADPVWVRPTLLALVGCVWGWAFFRFDALTVVLSHLTCDLFIFNYPQLAQGGWAAVGAVAAILVPLLPAAAGLLARGRGPTPYAQTPEV